jgi:hypothetical protein
MKKWLARGRAKSGNRGESSTALESVTRDRIKRVSKQFFTDLWRVGDGSLQMGAPSHEYKQRVEVNPGNNCLTLPKVVGNTVLGTVSNKSNKKTQTPSR